MAPETGIRKLKQNVGIMARKFAVKASARRSALIRINPDAIRPDKALRRRIGRIQNWKDRKRANLPNKAQGELDEDDHF